MSWNRVAVVGAGLIKMGELFDQSYEDMAAGAFNAAVASVDKGFDPKAVDAAFVATQRGTLWGQEGIGGNTVPSAIGLSGVASTRIENACPSGSDAFRIGAMAVMRATKDRRAIPGVKALLNDPDLPGDWVRWKKVLDPADEGPAERVFALDESTGEIRFGDGLHGAIPPVGRDSIVAFQYQRTEPPAKGAIDVPANAIEARTQLNLVTPVGGVEAVFSADHSAGGAPPEPDDRVLRFGSAKLRHRGRAVTARDLEDLALASSPDIVQARALVHGRRTRLVIVMRGNETSPNAAQRRELGRLLLGVSPLTFSAANALAIEGPSVRQLRIRLGLRVDSLDHAGGVAEDVTARVQAFFDSATGGLWKDGWPLGASPRGDDIALALSDVPHLESIADIALVEALDDETERPWAGPLKPNQRARLADEAIRFEFESMEAIA